MLSMLPLVGLLAQPLWGQTADRSGGRRGILALVTIGTGLAQLLLFRAGGFAELLASTAVLAIFASAVMPMALSVSLAVLHADGRTGGGRAARGRRRVAHLNGRPRGTKNG